MAEPVGVLVDRIHEGGVEKVAIQQVRHLRAQGVDARLVVLKRLPGVPAIFGELLDGVPIDYLDDRLPRWLRSSWRIPFFRFFSFFHLSYAVLLPWFLPKRTYRAIVSHNSYTTFTARALSRRCGIPYLMLVWDPIAYILEKAYAGGPIRTLRPVLAPLGRWTDDLLLSSARALILVSDRHADYIRTLAHGGLPTVLIPPGCDPAVAVPRRRGDFVLSVTAWKRGKQLEVLLEAVRRVPAASLVVAGAWVDAEYEVDMLALVERLGLRERVLITGALEEAELTDLYRRARLTVICNAELGFGLPAMEAGANGCPFACPPSCGIAHHVRPEHGAAFFAEGDVDALAEIVHEYCERADLAYERGRRIWRRVREVLDWKVHATTLQRALDAYTE